MPDRKERHQCSAVVACCLSLVFATLAASPGRAADEPDLIFKRSTVFKWLTPQ